MGLDILLETNVYIDNLSFVGLNTLGTFFLLVESNVPAYNNDFNQQKE